jgi:hypothetical protein
MKLANEDVSMLAFTSEQITVPFLLPEMVTTFPFFTTYVCYPQWFQWPKLCFCQVLCS